MLAYNKPRLQFAHAGTQVLWAGMFLVWETKALNHYQWRCSLVSEFLFQNMVAFTVNTMEGQHADLLMKLDRGESIANDLEAALLWVSYECTSAKATQKCAKFFLQNKWKLYHLSGNTKLSGNSAWDSAPEIPTVINQPPRANKITILFLRLLYTRAIIVVTYLRSTFLITELYLLGQTQR